MLNMFNTRNFMKLNNSSYKTHSQMKMLKLTQFNSMGFRPSNTLFKKDYYKTLGVDRNSPQADVKKAYFRGAKKLHPDVNKDENAQEKFAEFNEAYETLRDENKRRIYDSTGMTGDEQAQQGGGPGGPFEGGGFPGGGSFWEQFQGGQRGPGGPGRQGQQGGVNFNDIFGEFEDFFNMGGGGQREPQQSKGRDVVINVNIEFLEAVNGTQKTVKYQKVDN
jgi:molecular chaperone DnaJ